MLLSTTEKPQTVDDYSKYSRGMCAALTLWCLWPAVFTHMSVVDQFDLCWRLLERQWSSKYAKVAGRDTNHY